MADRPAREAVREAVREARPARAIGAWRNGRATMLACREFPTNISRQDGAPREVWTRFFDAFAELTPGRYRAAFRLRRPASAGSRRDLSRARRNRRPAVAAEPSAAPDRRGRMAAIDRRHRAARRIAGTGAERPLRRGPIGRRRRDPRGRHCRQHRISALGLRHQAAGRPISQSVCRRCRPRTRWTLVGAGRPHPGAVRRRLCAGKPAGAVARLYHALQIDECRARGAVLRGVPRQSCAPAPTATSRASGC